jgi:hypothetical protein
LDLGYRLPPAWWTIPAALVGAGAWVALISMFLGLLQGAPPVSLPQPLDAFEVSVYDYS